MCYYNDNIFHVFCRSEIDILHSTNAFENFPKFVLVTFVVCAAAVVVIGDCIVYVYNHCDSFIFGKRIKFSIYLKKESTTGS